jgi:iron complex transport system ATP-binding protein
MTEIVATDISVRAGDATLLSEVDCSIHPGQVLAIVGPNGAGKSTLLSVLAGDRRPDTGDVRYAGEDVRELSLADLSIRRSVLSQDLPARIPFTVGELVELGRHPHRGDPRNSTALDDSIVADAIAAVELDGWEQRIVATLSGGERLRAHLARVLAQEAPVVLLDEPTSALDIAHQEHVLSLCESLAASGRAVAIVLHDLNAAARYADRILILNRGSVGAVGTPNEVLTAGLLSDVYRQPIAVSRHPHRDCPLVLVVDR